MSLFDTIKYPLSSYPSEQELNNLPTSIYNILLNEVIVKFYLHVIGPLTKERWPPDRLSKWFSYKESKADLEILRIVLNEVRKAIASL